MRWSLTARLRLGFVVVWLGALASAAAIWWVALDYRNQINHAYGTHLRGVAQLTDVNPGLWHLRQGMLQFMTGSPEARQRVLGAADKWHALIEARLDSYDGTAHDPEERRGLADVRAAYGRFKQARATVFELWRAGEGEEAIAGQGRAAMGLNSETARAVDAQLALQRAVSAREQSRSERRARVGIALATAVTAALFALLVAGYWQVLRALRPIRALRYEAMALMRERLGEDMPVDTGDNEVAALASGVRLLSGRLLAHAEQLRQSEERLDSLLRASPAVIYAATAHGRYGATFISANVREQLGYAPEDFLSDPDFWANHIHPDDREQVLAQQARLSTEERGTCEYRFRHQDGSWRWMHDQTNLVRDEAGAPRELVGSLLDISARRQAEDALHDSMEWYQTVVEAADEGILISDDRGRVTELNSAAERAFGYRRDQALGLDLAELLIPDSQGGAERELFRRWVVSGIPAFGGQPTEVVARHADGHEVPIELTVRPLRRGGRTFFAAFARDLTAARQAVAALRESEELYRTLFSQSGDALFTLEPPAWKFGAANATAVALFGARDEAELLEDGPAAVSPERQPDGLASADKARAMIGTALRVGVHSFEWLHRRLTGETFLATVLLTRLSHGGRVSVQATVRDISAQRRAEQALERLNRIQAEFMANITHELRTPLHTVLGFAGLLKDQVPGPLNPKQVAFAADIVAAGERLLRLVDGILEMSRLVSGEGGLAREPVDIEGALLERVAAHRGAAEARRLTLKLEVADDTGTAEVDPYGLRRIVDVLLDNAIGFTEGGGTVTVRARHEAGWLEIAVADTGVGIAPGDLARLFRPLAQINGGLGQRRDGIGLGLALAQRLAEAHGGVIEVASAPGQGSTFTLRIPGGQAA